MKAFVKPALVLGIAVALALGGMSPSEARGFQPFVAAGIGLAAGAAIAGAAANSIYYNGGYYDSSSYGYGPGYGAYSYDPGYVTGPVYSEPGYGYQNYGYTYYGPRRYPEQSRQRVLQGHDY